MRVFLSIFINAKCGQWFVFESPAIAHFFWPGVPGLKSKVKKKISESRAMVTSEDIFGEESRACSKTAEKARKAKACLAAGNEGSSLASISAFSTEPKEFKLHTGYSAVSEQLRFLYFIGQGQR